PAPPEAPTPSGAWEPGWSGNASRESVPAPPPPAPRAGASRWWSGSVARHRNMLRGLILALGRAWLDGGPAALFPRGNRDAPPPGIREGEAGRREADDGAALAPAGDEVVTTPLFPRDDPQPFPVRLSETIARMRKVWGGAAD